MINSKITNSIAPRLRLKSRHFSSRFSQPGPIPLGDLKQQAEIDRLIKQRERELLTEEEPVKKEILKSHPDGVNQKTGEVDGPKGPEPTRYGDWERQGRVYDF